MDDEVWDDDVAVWEQFATAVRVLAGGWRPGLRMAEAHREALEGWCAEQASVFNRDRPLTGS